MGDKTGIEWCDATWNPIVGCSVVSPGCTHCYAMKMAARLEKMGQPIYRGLTQPSKAGPVWTGKVELSNHGQVIRPLSWKRPRRIFVNSMSDLFHESLPDEAIDKVFAIMALGLRHTFQVLTKRPERMRDYLATRGKSIEHWERAARDDGFTLKFDGKCLVPFPLPNVWLGVSAEDQERADERVPHLLATPAAVRFVSAEPLLGPIDFTDLDPTGPARATNAHGISALWKGNAIGRPCLDWVIVGGESGPKARPMHPDWARAIRDQCQAAGVPFFFKQWGEWVPWEPEHGPCWVSQAGRSEDHHVLFPTDIADDPPGWDSGLSYVDGDTTTHAAFQLVGKKRAGHLLDGREHREWPRGAGHEVSP